MLKVVITLICVLISYRIIFKKDVGLLYVSMFLISPAIVVLSFPFEIQFKRWIVITLFLFYIVRHLFYKTNPSSSFPLKKTIFLMFLGSVILISFDSRFSPLYRLLYPILDAFDVYLVLLLAFFFSFYAPIEKQYKYVVIAAFISVLYGIFNYITGLNPISDLINSIYSSGEGYTVDVGSRQYVKSFCRYVFDFGFNCALLSLMLAYRVIVVRNVKAIEYFAFILTLGGVVLSGTRTMLLAAVFSLLLLMVISLKLTKLFKYFMVLGCLGILSYFIIPPVTNMIDLLFNTIFRQNYNVAGSSLDMRMSQMSGAVSLWLQDPIWGNGYKYIFNELALSEQNYASEMAGYESIIFQLLIERGIVGIVIYCIFFISVLIYFYKNRHYVFSKLGISVLSLFLVGAVGTGALDSWCNSMIICGFIIGSIECQKHNRQINYS